MSKFHYVEFKRQLEIEKEDATVKASQYNFDDAQSVQNYGYFMANKDRNNSYTYVNTADFRVARQAASSIQPKKNRPLVASAKMTDASVNESNDSRTQDKGNVGSQP